MTTPRIWEREKTVVASFLSQMVMQSSGVVMLFVLGGALGPEQYGVYSFLVVLQGIFIPVCSIGTGYNIVRLAARDGDVPRNSSVLLSCLALVIGIGAVISILIASASTSLDEWFLKVNGAARVLCVTAVLPALLAVEELLRQFYRARLRIITSAVIDSVTAILVMVATWGVVWRGGALLEVGWVLVVTRVLGLFLQVGGLLARRELILPTALLPMSQVQGMIRFGIPIVFIG